MSDSNTTAISAISGLIQNPAMFILVLLILGGQGADLFASNNSTAEVRELREDVQDALDEITSNAERINRVEERIDGLTRTMDDGRAGLSEYQRLLGRALQAMIEEG